MMFPLSTSWVSDVALINEIRVKGVWIGFFEGQTKVFGDICGLLGDSDSVEFPEINIYLLDKGFHLIFHRC